MDLTEGTYIFACIHTNLPGLPRWLSVIELTCHCRRCRRWGVNPCVRKIPWSRKWQVSPVFLSGESHGERSLAGCHPWSCKESGMTEHSCMIYTLRCVYINIYMYILHTCTHTHTYTHVCVFIWKDEPAARTAVAEPHPRRV